MVSATRRTASCSANKSPSLRPHALYAFALAVIKGRSCNSNSQANARGNVQRRAIDDFSLSGVKPCKHKIPTLRTGVDTCCGVFAYGPGVADTHSQLNQWRLKTIRNTATKTASTIRGKTPATSKSSIGVNMSFAQSKNCHPSLHPQIVIGNGRPRSRQAGCHPKDCILL